jgi:hypothetical protein
MRVDGSPPIRGASSQSHQWYYKARNTVLARLKDLVEQHRMASLSRDESEEKNLKSLIRLGRKELDLLDVIKFWNDSSGPRSRFASRNLDSEVENLESTPGQAGIGCPDNRLCGHEEDTAM